MEQDNDGKITLIDGSVIQGYTPQRITNEYINNRMELDGRGEYLTLGGQKPSIKNKVKGEEGRAFFTDNAFFFLSHSKEILSDSRMFLSRIPIQNGLAYTGASGFRIPILGVYLEWWLTCKDSALELDGQKWLVWFISGSPLSGSNACAIVNEQGEIRKYTNLNFSNIWTSFVRINIRYDSAKTRYVWFTLDEVVNIVRNNKTDKIQRKLMLDYFFSRSYNRQLIDRIKNIEERCDCLQKELTEARIRLNIDTLRGIYNQYKEACKQVYKKREELKLQRMKLRERLRTGYLTNIEYQSALHPINKGLRCSMDMYASFDCELQKKNIGVSMRDIEQFFENETLQKE